MSHAEDYYIGSAAGWCKTVEHVRELARSAAFFITVGSYTVNAREGNPGDVFNQKPGFSLNSLGMPNRGLKYLETHGDEMVISAHSANKPIYLSVAGFSPEEYKMLAQTGFDLGFDGVELNLGCPNVADGGKRKTIASFDLGIVREILDSVGKPAERTTLMLKVSPMTNPSNIIDLATLVSEYPIYAVVTMNTLPNCLDLHPNNKSVINTPDGTGWAGGAGSSILPVALGQISQWRKALPEHIHVWGVGGLQSGEAARKMFFAGASAMQVATGLFVYGPKIFSDIALQL